MEKLIGLTDIGRKLGVSRQRAGQLAEEYADFPAPVAETANGRAWRPADVDGWIAAHPERPAGRPPKEA